MSELFTNLARSSLASGITAGALSLTVQSGDGNDLFPVLGGSDNFRCVIFKKSTGDIEIINVTARSGDVFTITRSQEKIGNLTATAFAFDAGDLIELRPTSEYFTGLAAGASSANIQHGTFLYGVDTGAADVYTVAMNPTAITIDVGQEVRVHIGVGNTNTGIAATLQLDAVTAGPITMEGGGNPPANSIRAGFVHTFNWDGTSFIFQSQGLALTSSGFNALGKQIKNVAAGTAATDAATIGGTETLTNKKISTTGITRTTVVQTYEAGVIGFTDATNGFIFRPPQVGLATAHQFTTFAGLPILNLKEDLDANFLGAIEGLAGSQIDTNGGFQGNGILLSTTAGIGYQAGSLGFTSVTDGFKYRPPQAGSATAHRFDTFNGTSILELKEDLSADFSGAVTATGFNGITTANITSAMSQFVWDSIGSYANLTNAGITIAPGGFHAGSNLSAAGVGVTGTWLCMGDGVSGGTTLWLRTA